MSNPSGACTGLYVVLREAFISSSARHCFRQVLGGLGRQRLFNARVRTRPLHCQAVWRDFHVGGLRECLEPVTLSSSLSL